jgi:tRNA G18 (ribose-2'-O)-methylase SpoU
MSLQNIQSLDDPSLAPYRNLKDKELARDGSRFIAEGENVVRRLLASSTPVESVLLADRKAAAIAPLVAARTPLFIAPDALIEQIIGFEFHSGVLACGIRPEPPSLDILVPPPPKPALIVVCQQITNTENLGSLIRVSAAFGADAMILGERCCDPYFRQSVRVSMGTIFSMPIRQSSDLLRDFNDLKMMGIERIASVLATSALPVSAIEPTSRVAAIFGNEADGLDPATLAASDRQATIPMKRGTDSLNVAIAAAVFLYQLTLPFKHKNP